jgi:hypothetical protein
VDEQPRVFNGDDWLTSEVLCKSAMSATKSHCFVSSGPYCSGGYWSSRSNMSKRSVRSGLQRAMRSVLPEEKHISVLLELTGPFKASPEYDRTAAIVSATFLEYALKKAIKRHFKPDSLDPDYSYLFAQDDAPYRDFAALNRLARALAIISPTEYERLETLRHVRNAFAHGMDHSLTFDSPDVFHAINALLKVNDEWFESITTLLTPAGKVALAGSRRAFIYSVFRFYWSLILYVPTGSVEPLLGFTSTIDR